ncbi:MAG: hypothetical protein H0W99_15890 [Acidobacteria bacterium]|nr:hypothetical protein [Acidobacteriota bacterium]
MVTKPKAADKKEKKGRVKVGKLKLNKETVKDLTGSEAKKIKGGKKPKPTCSIRLTFRDCM